MARASSSSASRSMSSGLAARNRIVCLVNGDLGGRRAGAWTAAGMRRRDPPVHDRPRRASESRSAERRETAQVPSTACVCLSGTAARRCRRLAVARGGQVLRARRTASGYCRGDGAQRYEDLFVHGVRCPPAVGTERDLRGRGSHGVPRRPRRRRSRRRRRRAAEPAAQLELDQELGLELDRRDHRSHVRSGAQKGYSKPRR